MSSAECLYGGQEVAGKVFDCGRLLKLITRYFYYIINNLNPSFSSLTFGFSVHHGLMQTYDANIVPKMILKLGYGLELLISKSNIFSFVKSGDKCDGIKLLVQFSRKDVSNVQLLVWKEVFSDLDI